MKPPTNLSAIVAAGGWNLSHAFLSAKAKAQLRDSKGRFIPMGGMVRWMSGGHHRWGFVLGKHDNGDILVKENGKNFTAKIKSKQLEVVKALIPDNKAEAEQLAHATEQAKKAAAADDGHKNIEIPEVKGLKAEDLTPATKADDPEPNLFVDSADFKKVGGQGGSNPGGVYEAPDGTRYYVKKAQSEQHAANEVLATQLYQKAGVDTPDVFLTEFPGDGSPAVASKMVDGITPLFPSGKTTPETLAEARKGFAMDAWLGNWDSIGLVYDNMMKTPDGKALRVDTGGALLYRAQGSPKGGLFSDTVGETETLRNASMNAQAAKIFGGMTNQDIANDIAATVNKVSDEDIAKLVDELPFSSDAIRSQLKQRLKNRRADLNSKFDVPQTPAAEEPKAEVPDAPSAPDAPNPPDETVNKFDLGTLHKGDVLELKSGKTVKLKDSPIPWANDSSKYQTKFTDVDSGHTGTHIGPQDNSDGYFAKILNSKSTSSKIDDAIAKHDAEPPKIETLQEPEPTTLQNGEWVKIEGFGSLPYKFSGFYENGQPILNTAAGHPAMFPQGKTASDYKLVDADTGAPKKLMELPGKKTVEKADAPQPGVDLSQPKSLDEPNKSTVKKAVEDLKQGDIVAPYGSKVTAKILAVTPLSDGQYDVHYWKSTNGVANHLTTDGGDDTTFGTLVNGSKDVAPDAPSGPVSKPAKELKVGDIVHDSSYGTYKVTGIEGPSGQYNSMVIQGEEVGTGKKLPNLPMLGDTHLKIESGKADAPEAPAGPPTPPPPADTPTPSAPEPEHPAAKIGAVVKSKKDGFEGTVIKTNKNSGYSLVLSKDGSKKLWRKWDTLDVQGGDEPNLDEPGTPVTIDEKTAAINKAVMDFGKALPDGGDEVPLSVDALFDKVVADGELTPEEWSKVKNWVDEYQSEVDSQQDSDKIWAAWKNLEKAAGADLGGDGKDAPSAGHDPTDEKAVQAKAKAVSDLQAVLDHNGMYGVDESTDHAKEILAKINEGTASTQDWVEFADYVDQNYTPTDEDGGPGFALSEGFHDLMHAMGVDPKQIKDELGQYQQTQYGTPAHEEYPGGDFVGPDAESVPQFGYDAAALASVFEGEGLDPEAFGFDPNMGKEELEGWLLNFHSMMAEFDITPSGPVLDHVNQLAESLGVPMPDGSDSPEPLKPTVAGSKLKVGDIVHDAGHDMKVIDIAVKNNGDAAVMLQPLDGGPYSFKTFHAGEKVEAVDVDELKNPGESGPATATAGLKIGDKVKNDLYNDVWTVSSIDPSPIQDGNYHIVFETSDGSDYSGHWAPDYVWPLASTSAPAAPDASGPQPGDPIHPKDMVPGMVVESAMGHDYVINSIKPSSSGGWDASLSTPDGKNHFPNHKFDNGINGWTVKSLPGNAPEAPKAGENKPYETVKAVDLNPGDLIVNKDGKVIGKLESNVGPLNDDEGDFWKIKDFDGSSDYWNAGPDEDVNVIPAGSENAKNYFFGDYVKVGDLHEGDSIIDPDGDKGEILSVTPSGFNKVEIEYKLDDYDSSFFQTLDKDNDGFFKKVGIGAPAEPELSTSGVVKDGEVSTTVDPNTLEIGDKVKASPDGKNLTVIDFLNNKVVLQDPETQELINLKKTDPFYAASKPAPTPGTVQGKDLKIGETVAIDGITGKVESFGTNPFGPIVTIVTPDGMSESFDLDAEFTKVDAPSVPTKKVEDWKQGDKIVVNGKPATVKYSEESVDSSDEWWLEFQYDDGSGTYDKYFDKGDTTSVLPQDAASTPAPAPKVDKNGADLKVGDIVSIGDSDYELVQQNPTTANSDTVYFDLKSVDGSTPDYKNIPFNKKGSFPTVSKSDGADAPESVPTGPVTKKASELKVGDQFDSGGGKYTITGIKEKPNGDLSVDVTSPAGAPIKDLTYAKNYVFDNVHPGTGTSPESAPEPSTPAVPTGTLVAGSSHVFQDATGKKYVVNKNGHVLYEGDSVTTNKGETGKITKFELDAKYAKVKFADGKTKVRQIDTLSKANGTPVTQSPATQSTPTPSPAPNIPAGTPEGLAQALSTGVNPDGTWPTGTTFTKIGTTQTTQFKPGDIVGDNHAVVEWSKDSTVKQGKQDIKYVGSDTIVTASKNNPWPIWEKDAPPLPANDHSVKKNAASLKKNDYVKLDGTMHTVESVTEDLEGNVSIKVTGKSAKQYPEGTQFDYFGNTKLNDPNPKPDLATDILPGAIGKKEPSEWAPGDVVGDTAASKLTVESVTPGDSDNVNVKFVGVDHVYPLPKNVPWMQWPKEDGQPLPGEGSPAKALEDTPKIDTPDVPDVTPEPEPVPEPVDPSQPHEYTSPSGQKISVPVGYTVYPGSSYSTPQMYMTDGLDNWWQKTGDGDVQTIALPAYKKNQAFGKGVLFQHPGTIDVTPHVESVFSPEETSDHIAKIDAYVAKSEGFYSYKQQFESLKKVLADPTGDGLESNEWDQIEQALGMLYMADIEGGDDEQWKSFRNEIVKLRKAKTGTYRGEWNTSYGNTQYHYNQDERKALSAIGLSPDAVGFVTSKYSVPSSNKNAAAEIYATVSDPERAKIIDTIAGVGASNGILQKTVGNAFKPALSGNSSPYATKPKPIPSLHGKGGALIKLGDTVIDKDGQGGKVVLISPEDGRIRVRRADGSHFMKKATGFSVTTAEPGSTAAPAVSKPYIAKPRPPFAKPDWTKPTLGGNTATAQQALDQVKSSNWAANHGFSFAADYDQIEDLDVHVSRILDQHGQELVELKFKVTPKHGKELQKRYSADPSWSQTHMQIEERSMANGHQLAKLKGTYKVTSNHLDGWTLRHTTEDGNKVELHQVSKPGEGPYSYHNMMQIRIPAGKATPEAIAKAMYDAGIDQPGPPTQDALKRFGENRLMSIFASQTNANTETLGQKREDLLKQIEQQWGMTWQDFEIHHGTNGRIELLFPQSVADKISAKTGVKAFQHSVSGGDARFVEIATNPHQALLSTTVRWSEGVPYSGMSSGTDVGTGGGDYVFFSPRSSIGGGGLIYDAKRMFRRSDFYANTNDKFGKRMTNVDVLSQIYHGAYETMFKHRASLDDAMGYVAGASRDSVIAQIKAKGITHIGGRTVEQFVVKSASDLVPPQPISIPDTFDASQFPTLPAAGGPAL